MKSFLLLMLFVSIAPAADWQQIRYGPGYSFAPAPPAPPAVATFTFPDWQSHYFYPAFLVVTQAETMNLSNATFRADFALATAGCSGFRFGGQGSWNTGSRPPNVRLFFACAAGYDNELGVTNYWFNDQFVVIATNLTAASLSVTVTTNRGWTDGYGKSTPETFWWAAQHVTEVGVAFGGGNFYDIGIAATGSCTFALSSFQLDPAFTINQHLQPIGGFVNNQYTLETNLSSPAILIRGKQQ